MKIRIIQLGFQTFTGLLGDVHFKDGVSVSDVSEQQAAYVRAMFVTEVVSEAADTSEQDAAVEAERLAVEAAAKAAEAEAEAEAEAAKAETAEVVTPEATEQVQE